MFNRIVSSVASRLAPDSLAKRNLVKTASWHMQDVAYARIRERGFDPSGIIDIGAHDGRWALSIKPIFPTSPILMIEAREDERFKLAAESQAFKKAEVVIALLGAEVRDDVSFAIHGSASSLFPERSSGTRSHTRLSMHTLDSIVAERPWLKAPLLMKLDVQGGELEILKGATATLAQAEVVQMEMALLPYNDGAPTASEVMSFMDQRGFAMFDITGFVRPHDRDLVQIDVLFVKNNSALRPAFFQF